MDFPYQPVVALTRGRIVESLHLGAVAVVDVNGKLTASYGDPEVITYLRSTRDSDGQLLMARRVANTLTGVVHFHEIPGEGTLDFAACFAALNENGFSGYASVELYHHVSNWEKALRDSYRHLAQFV